MASSSYIKGITIKIDGDSKGLAKSLGEVNSDLKKTNSALKDVEKALKLDPNNVELLAQKQTLLNQKIEQTREKLQLEEQAAAKAKDALEIGDITQAEYASLQAEVATTAKELENLEDSAKDSGESIEDTGEEAKEAGNKAKESGDKFVNWGDVVKSAAKVAATAVAAVGTAVAAMGGAVIAGGKALVNAAGDVSEYGEMVDKSSQRVGMSTDAWQRWNYAMQMSGTSMAESEAGIKALTNSMDDAINGSKSAIEKFQTLGITVDDLNSMSREEVFAAVVGGLQNVDDEGRRAALAVDFFSRSGMNMIPMLNESEESLQALLQEADEYGTVMSSEMVEASAEYDDALGRMNASLEGLKNRMVGQFLPGLTEVVNGIAGMAAGIDGSEQQVQGGVETIVSTFEGMIPTILETIDTLLPSLLEVGLKIISTVGQGIISNLGMILETAMSLISSLASALLAPENIEMMLNAAVEILMQLVGGLIEAIDLLIEPAVTAVLTLVEALLSTDNISKLTDAAIHIILAVVEGLTGAIPTLIPTAVKAVTTIVQGLLDNWDKIVVAAEELVVAIIQGLLNALPDLLGSIVGDMIPAMIRAFMTIQQELPGMALKWGKDLITSLVNGITQSISKLKNAVKNIANTIASYLHFSEPDVGPLANAHTFMPDMIELFAKGMTSSLPTLETAVTQTANVIAGVGDTPDYTGVLNGISSQIGAIGGGRGTYVINVQVGTTTLATAVLSAQQMEAFRSGGV